MQETHQDTPAESESQKDQKSPFYSTRHNNPDLMVPEIIGPRNGRRESEPHSAEISYIYDVFSVNFPQDRVIWDLHHYFNLEGEKIDIQFDLSFFRGFNIPYSLSSYNSAEYQGRVPDIAINILSKSTWQTDIGVTVEYCRSLKIPIYIIFSPFASTSKLFAPPFVRAYILDKNGQYQIRDLRTVTIKEGIEKIEKNWIDLNPHLPIYIGLMELTAKHEGNRMRYRMILIDSITEKVLPTLSEKEKKRADEEKKRADEEKKRADEEQKRADKEKEIAEKLKRELDVYKKKFGKI